MSGRHRRDDREASEAQRALEHSRRAAQAARETERHVLTLAERLRRLRQDNHFAEGVMRLLAGD